MDYLIGHWFIYMFLDLTIYYILCYYLNHERFPIQGNFSFCNHTSQAH